MGKNKPLLWVFGIFMAVVAVIIANLGIDVFMTQPQMPNYTGNTVTDTANQAAYDTAMNQYNFTKFLVLSITGTILILLSLFLTGLLPFEVGLTFAGFIMLIEGLVHNWNDKVKVFITAIIILVLIIAVLYRKLLKKGGW